MAVGVVRRNAGSGRCSRAPGRPRRDARAARCRVDRMFAWCTTCGFPGRNSRPAHEARRRRPAAAARRSGTRQCLPPAACTGSGASTIRSGVPSCQPSALGVAAARQDRRVDPPFESAAGRPTPRSARSRHRSADAVRRRGRWTDRPSTAACSDFSVTVAISAARRLTSS